MDSPGYCVLSHFLTFLSGNNDHFLTVSHPEEGSALCATFSTLGLYRGEWTNIAQS